jgi:starch synthase (maltosyl-transferring)
VRICQIDLTGTSDADEHALQRVAALGFDHVLIGGWPHLPGEDAFAACARHGLAPLLDISLDRYAVDPADGTGPAPDPGWIDSALPAFAPHETDSHIPGARLRWHDQQAAEALGRPGCARLGWQARRASAAVRRHACPAGIGPR